MLFTKHSIFLALSMARMASTRAATPTLYAVLGVPKSASTEEIKAAFRKRAREVHPDAPQGSSITQQGHSEWIVTLHAYEILSNARSRQLYDLSLSQGSSQILRNAASAGVHAGAGEGDEEIDLSWGLGPWSRQAGSKASSASAIDRVRGQLRDDFYTALRHAYLGPALTDLQRGQFPDCFEGDERSTLDTADVLQLVSGRQLLGVVRERRPEALAGEDATAPQFLNAGGNSGPGTAGRDVRGTTTAPGEGPEQAWQSTGGAEAGAEQAASGSKPRPKDDLVLDLILEDNIIASAVKHVEARAISAAEGSTHSVCLASFYKNGSLMAQLLRESEEGEAEQPLNGEMNPKPKKTSALSSQSHVTKLACTNAGPTYTVLRANTPLVRHLSFVAELAGSGGGGGAATPSSTPFTRGMKGGSVCVARAHRAWLPPSSLWLFQPRSYCHDIGGWTFTWAGHANEGHPAWLDPALVVLVAALHTVEHEEAARQPQGVFARARQGDETEGGVLAWVRAMLRFHRRPEQ